MARDKKKKDGRAKKPDRDSAPGKSNGSAPRKRVRVAKAVKAKAAELASNPLVAEVVAATLVAAAAALKNPQKARALAGATAEELQGLAGSSKSKSGVLWALALDVARRSLESAGSAVEAEVTGKKGKAGGKKKKGKT